MNARPMRASMRSRTRLRGRTHGVAAVEFAIVATVFFTLILGIADFGRWLFTLNAASEATRYGARVAVVCDIGDTAVVAKMQRLLPQLTATNVRVTYFTSPTPTSWTAGCAVENCAAAQVRLQGFTIPGIAWFLPRALPIPSFSTTMTRESLRSSIDGSANPICE
jgi:Flp pilus assembly protein TadG